MAAMAKKMVVFFFCELFSAWTMQICVPLALKTSSSAATERPREPLSQLKSCQLLHNCTKNHI